jgi:adenine deaminase
MNPEELVSVARGDKPADLLIKNAQIINTFIGETEQADVAIYGDRIAGIGDYDKAREVTDLEGALSPGALWLWSPTCTKSPTFADPVE